MAKKKQKPAPSRISRKKTIWIVVAALLITLICFFGIRALIHHQQTEAAYKVDKVRFAATEKDLNTAYDAIVAKLGKPYETRINKGCSYGALKYARGPLSCGYGYTFSYGVSSRTEGKVIGDKIIGLLNGNYNFSKGVVDYGSSELAIESGQYVVYLHNTYGLSCEIKHDVYAKKDFNGYYNLDGLKQDANTSFISVSNVSCNGYTPKPLYMLDKSIE